MPVIATAALATGVGFLVLLLSPVPMVRGFGALLVAGIAIAFALALTAGTAALSLRPRDGGLARSLRGAGELTRGRGARGSGARCAGPARPRRRRGRARRAAPAGPRAGASGWRSPCVGWGLDSRTEVVSDIDRLVPQDLAAVQDLKTLQQATGVAGEIDVVIEGDDLTDPAVVKWMRDYQSGVLERYGYSAERGCGARRPVPGAVAARPLPLVGVGRRPRARSARCSTPCRRTSRAR